MYSFKRETFNVLKRTLLSSYENIATKIFCLSNLFGIIAISNHLLSNWCGTCKMFCCFKAILHYTTFGRAGGANLSEHKTFRTIRRSRTRHGSRNVFYFHGVPASAKAYGNSYACVFFRMFLQVRSARGAENNVKAILHYTSFARAGGANL